MDACEAGTKAFVFDMDGVVVDTIDGLYRIYREFLAEHGVAGTRAEFESLNGPSLREIVRILRARYRLDADEDQLLHRYLGKVEGLYDQVSLVAGVREAMAAVRARGFALGLVSSAPRVSIERVLERFGLTFDVVVSGDDVPEAKPSPAIYEKARAALPGRPYAIEDSSHGIASARAAGFTVIGFHNPDRSAHFTATSMEQVREIIEGCRAFTGPVDLELVTHHVNCDEVDRRWASRPSPGNGRGDEGPALFDGPMLAYLDHERVGGRLKVRCFVSSYRFFYARAIAPLSVSGITLDRRGRVLIGERADVTEYPGRTELVPSGSLQDTDYAQQLARELHEEAGIRQTLPRKLETLGLLHDVDHNVYDIACKITLAELFPQAASPEYRNLRVVESLAGVDLIPTSMALARLAGMGPRIDEPPSR